MKRNYPKPTDDFQLVLSILLLALFFAGLHILGG